MPPVIDEREDQVAEFGLDRIRVLLRHGILQLVQLLRDLVEDRLGILPVEADARRALLQLEGARQRRMADRYVVQIAALAGLAAGILLGPLARLHLFPHALGQPGAAGILVAEDMRVPADHLGGDGLDDVAEGEYSGLLGHARVVDHLQKQVAELVAQIVEIAALDRVGHLIGFLDRVRRDGREILFEVPGTAGHRRPQRGHDLDQAVNILGGCHGDSLPTAAAGAQWRRRGEGACPQARRASGVAMPVRVGLPGRPLRSGSPSS